MRIWWLIGVVATTLHPIAPAAPQVVPQFSFHHLHLNDSRSPFLLDFYERLFDPATTRRLTANGVEGLQSGPMRLLISRVPVVQQQPTAIWHFGWGGVSLGETYLAHARQEVAWEPPLPAERLHVHLRSVSPLGAAAWYRDVLGLRVEIDPPGDAIDQLPRPEHRTPEALAWIGETGLLIYRTEPPLFSTRGQQADHLAIACSDLDAAIATLRSRGAVVLAAPVTTANTSTAMIEGPDHLAIELVEIK